MKKYSLKDGVNRDNLKLEILCGIANEIAESNRLKLIELRIKCQEFGFPQEKDMPDMMIRANELTDHVVDKKPNSEVVA